MIEPPPASISVWQRVLAAPEWTVKGHLDDRSNASLDSSCARRSVPDWIRSTGPALLTRTSRVPNVLTVKSMLPRTSPRSTVSMR